MTHQNFELHLEVKVPYKPTVGLKNYIGNVIISQSGKTIFECPEDVFVEFLKYNTVQDFISSIVGVPNFGTMLHYYILGVNAKDNQLEEVDDGSPADD